NPACFSFEAADASGTYLRHSGYRLYANANDSTSLFAHDATFCPQTGRSGSETSFFSYNYPEKYLRHYNNNLYVASDGGSNTWDAASLWPADATWAVSSPWSP